jgi:hypothetical protein
VRPSFVGLDRLLRPSKALEGCNREPLVVPQTERGSGGISLKVDNPPPTGGSARAEGKKQSSMLMLMSPETRVE